MIKKLGKYISPIFYILLLYFLISYTRTLDLDTLAKVELNYYAILFASVIALVSRYIGAYTWIAILKSLGSPVREYRQLFYVYSKSWLGRYIPGKVAWIMGRIHFAAQQGIDKSSLALSTFLESGLQISVVLAMSLLIISIGSNSKVIDANLKLALLAPTLAILLFLTPPVFNRVFNFIYRKIKKSDLQVKISPRSIRIGVSFYILNFFTSGLAYFMITKAVFKK